MLNQKMRRSGTMRNIPVLRALVPEVMTLSYVIGTPLPYLVLLPRLRILWDCLGIRVSVRVVVVGVLCTPWDKVNNMLARR
ncbi:hypothetical protein AAC387_Pa03g1568 [Persea americana]